MKQIPEPYASIIDMPFDPHGWFENQDALSKIFERHHIHTIIEVGSWLGLSTRFLAQKLPDDGKLYAVDTWLGSDEFSHQNDPRLAYLFQLFLSNVKHAQLTHKIVPVRMASLEAASALAIHADLIYLDASHKTDDVVQDILAWHPHLEPNGILCGDDWNWPSVRKGVCEAANAVGLKPVNEDNFWFLSFLSP